jgi:transposase-like protein
MTLYNPATAYSSAIVRPDCPKCGTKMWLARISPDKVGYYRHSFECPSCNHEEIEIVKKT